MLTTPPQMTAFLGKNIKEICPFSLGKDDGANHCAHFVSHAMQYDFGHTCKNATFSDKHSDGVGGTIRVNEIFNASPQVSIWDEVPISVRLQACLLFVTISGNMSKVPSGRLFMGANKRKHVGIYVNGQVWNYSNSHDKVVADSEVLFKTKFNNSYRVAGNTVEFYYGQLLK